ncbi:MAG TPA: hypothetical protein PLU33_04610 [Treponemataceae bacterium]|nr:hypothetical protein [Treponemataceae bacterium]HQL04396.1 hypothetical protein [Treponemataceae bacterium]
MKKVILLIIVCMFTTSIFCAQDVDIVFPAYDGSHEYLSMRQSNTLYTSSFRFFSEQLDKAFPELKVLNSPVLPFCSTLAVAFLFNPITHEEGHRAILTNLNIGSVSQPVINIDGIAYVKGVTDSTLQNLRDTDLPMFIRIHTAGLESDYCLVKKDMELMCFDLDRDTSTYFDRDRKLNFKVLFPDYWARVIGIYYYMYSGLGDTIFEKLHGTARDFVGDEEENELDRDIVGHDIYGMVHHLFQPGAEYQRYFNFNELTDEEQSFTRRIAWRALINFISPMQFSKYNFKLTDNMFISGSAGYCIAPFGDFIDENIFFKYDKFNISFYARQAQNRNTWFPAFGLGLVEYKPVEWFSATVRGHFWMQPENLDFNTAVGTPGGAGEVSLSFVLPSKNEEVIKGVGINIGALYKTKGFMPEIESHDAHFRLSAGLVVRY